jgi:hypothetical protein
MFSWSGLKGRRLDSWANPTVYVPGGGPAQDNEIATFVEMPLETPLSAIAPFVDEATRLLFAAFDGTQIPSNVVDEWSRRLVERRLSF